MASSVYGQVVSPFSPAEIKQITDFSCAVKSQQLVMKLFDIEVTEEALMEEAFENGILSTSGTPLYAIGQLMERHGVETNTYPNGNIAILMHELAQGHQVIVGVDSDELWHPNPEAVDDNTADHAIIVTGIDASNPNDVRVIVTDPGKGEVTSYAYNQFIDAWADSRCFMVATAEAPGATQLNNLNDELIETLFDRAFTSLADAFHDFIIERKVTNLQELIFAYPGQERQESADEFFAHGILNDIHQNNDSSIGLAEEPGPDFDIDNNLLNTDTNTDLLQDF